MVQKLHLNFTVAQVKMKYDVWKIYIFYVWEVLHDTLMYATRWKQVLTWTFVIDWCNEILWH